MARKPVRAKRPNATGRNDRASSFVSLPWRILESAAYASLDLTARGLLTELVHLYKGNNNGSLYLSARDGRDRLGLADCRPVMRAFGDLQDRGLIELAKEAYFKVRASETSRARCWRLTWHAWPESPVKTRRAPTNDWEKYQPPGGTRTSKRADKRLRALAAYRKATASGRLPVVNFPTMEAEMPDPDAPGVVNFTTSISAKRANPPFAVGVKSTTHVDNTTGMVLAGWWASPVEAKIAGQILLLSIVAKNRPPWLQAA